MRKQIKLMLSELPAILNVRFRRVRCCDSILIGSDSSVSRLSPGNAGELPVIDPVCLASGRTAYESFSNHFHLYVGRIRHSEFQELKTLSLAIGQNLYERLHATFPDSSFRLYVEINVNEGIVLRFHQVWPGETPVYSDDIIADSKSSKEFQIYLFSSANE